MSLGSTNRKSLFKSVKTPNKELSTPVCIFWINTDAVYRDKNRENNMKHYYSEYKLSQHLVNADNLLHVIKIIDLWDSIKLKIALYISLEAVGISRSKIIRSILASSILTSITITFNQVHFSICFD